MTALPAVRVLGTVTVDSPSWVDADGAAGSVTTTVVTVVVPSSLTFVVLVVVCVSSAPSGPVTD